MADAKATICYLNGLSLRTINEVEKILRALPKQGDRCEMQISRASCADIGRSTGDVIASKSMQIREAPRPLALSPPVEKKEDDSVVKKTDKAKTSKKTSEYSCMSSVKEEVKKMEVRTTNTSGVTSTTASKVHCKVLTDQVRVSPIVACNGVILELDVEVTIPDREEKKKLKLEIECPDFVPSRMKIGNKWKKIVEF
ncbi:unnamed protein product [Caenorhabditis nigoni]|uniref:Uncharacterized protein n=1 Tax=Caenorhabditis nigoni TaxID=1611254 RepID=A0A2G5UFP7_9PELO|nr:hypothetical protein B9Z55_010187 [Caenorhabditis nigoni]